MARIAKEILRVGTYVRAGRDKAGKEVKVAHTFDRPRLERIARTFQEAKQAGLHVPFVWEHTDPGDKSGKEGPQKRKRLADQAKNGGGWVENVYVTDDGVLMGDIEPAGKDNAVRLSNGSVRFVSPQINDQWTDYTGRDWRDVLYNVAGTHHPIDGHQRPFGAAAKSAPIQLSHDDYIGVLQMADDDEERGEQEAETSRANEENPDMPKGEQPDDAKLQALLAHLEKRGLALQADTTYETLPERLLGALIAVDAMETKNKADETETDKDDEGDDSPVTEEKPPMQFSHKALAPALARVAEAQRSLDDRRIKSLLREGRITPALAKRLTAAAGTVQLSDEGQALASLTVPEVIDMLDAGTVEGMALTKDYTATLSEHQGDEAFYRGKDGQLTDEQAKAKTKEFLARTGGK